MPRRYHSARRAAAAQQTRLDIVEAAIRLHARGVTELADLAVEAGVALPTVRKHFPTKERVFEACTAHGLASAAPFPFGELAQIADPADRIVATVGRLYALFEGMLGVSWTAYRLADESPAFAGVLARVAVLVRRIAEVLVTGPGVDVPDSQRAATIGFIHGILSPLAYRALRLEGGLDLESAAGKSAHAIGCALGVRVTS